MNGQVDNGAGNVALEFIGTLHNRGPREDEDFSTPTDLARWIESAGLLDTAPSIRAHELAAALGLREAIYRLLRVRTVTGARTHDTTLGEDIERINAAATTPPPIPQLTKTGAIQIVGDLDAALSALARAALQLLGSGELSVLKWCDDENCTRAFLDRSRGGRRRWCGMASCGNRAKVSAFRARRRVD